MSNHQGSVAENIVGAFLYVALIVFSLLLLGFLNDLNLDSVLPAQAITMASMILLIIVLEYIFPYRKEWNKKDGSEAANLGYFILIANVLPKFVTLFWSTVLLGSYIVIQSKLDIDTIWVSDWPIYAQAFLVLMIAEPIRYWFHRAGHEIPILWRLHEIHHSSKRMNWLATMRFHPLEKAIWMTPELVPFILLGVSPEVMAIYYVFNSVNSIIQHSNIKMPVGPLNWIFNLQAHHYWHHSKIIEESNANYGSNLIIWDFLFGTHYLPKDRQVGQLGLLDNQFPKNLFLQIVRPFRTKNAEDSQPPERMPVL